MLDTQGLDTYQAIAFSGMRPAYITYPRFCAAERVLRRQPSCHQASALLSTAQGRVDIISDIHGCFQEVSELLARLGWSISAPQGSLGPLVPSHHDDQRRLVLLGDLVTRGPLGMDCLRLALGMHESGTGTTLLGNHDWQLLAVSRHACFPPPRSGHADRDLDTLAHHPLRERVWAMLATLPEQVCWHDHNWGGVVLAHAAPAGLLGLPTLPAAPHATPATAASYTRLYGYQLWDDQHVQQLDWRPHHRATSWCVFGHQPFARPTLLGHTLGLDLGQSLGGSMAALSWDQFDPSNLEACTITTGPGLPPIGAPASWRA